MRIPDTSHNSYAAIWPQVPPQANLESLFEQVQELMLADFQAGSDPGLCLAAEFAARQVIEFGQRVQREIVGHQEARNQALLIGARLIGLGGLRTG